MVRSPFALSRVVPFAAAAVLIFLAAPIRAQSAPPSRVNASAGLTETGAPLAVHGFDVVAYFTEGTAVRGKAEFTTTHDGAAYRFASAANRDRFTKAPNRYLPEFGGFCAYGVSLGAKFDGDPEVFAIVDGKLYLNLSPEIQKLWNQDVAGYIGKAETAWTKIRDTPASELGS